MRPCRDYHRGIAKVFPRHALLTVTFAALVVPRQAQPQPPGQVVAGVVFDSTAGVPLAGAIVQIVESDLTSHAIGRSWGAVADSLGQFRIPSVPPGRFAIGFQHEALAALGLASPVRIMEVSSGKDVTVDLSIPSSVLVRRVACQLADSVPIPGMIVGYVMSASSGQLLRDAAVAVEWTQSSTGSTPVLYRIAATLENAHFTICGSPVDSPVDVTVAGGGYRSLHGQISIPASGVLRRDFHMVDLRLTQGTAAVSARIVQADGMPVVAGKVVIAALDRQTEIVNGKAFLSGLPAGSWSLEARALGYETRSAIIDLVSDSVTADTIRLAVQPYPLEPVSVNASDAYAKILPGILERKRVGFGTFFLPGDERLTRAKSLTDLARVATGFHITSKGFIEGRVVGGLGNRRCRPTIYVDGLRADPAVPIPFGNVLAVAAFPDLAGVPVELRDGRNCSVILVWMKP